MHAGKLGQVTNFTIMGGTAKHCVDQYIVFFSSLGGDTAMLGGLHARLCHAFLVGFVPERAKVLMSCICNATVC